MARSPSRSHERPSLSELVRMSTESGLPVVQTEIRPDGTIVLFHAEERPSFPSPSPFDDWKAKRNAR